MPTGKRKKKKEEEKFPQDHCVIKEIKNHVNKQIPTLINRKNNNKRLIVP